MVVIWVSFGHSQHSTLVRLECATKKTWYLMSEAFFNFIKNSLRTWRLHTGAYGTPPGTRTDSGSRQLIVPPHRLLYTGVNEQQTTITKIRASCLRTGRPNNRKTVLFRPPGHPRRLPLPPGSRLCHPDPPIPLSLPLGSAFVH